MSQTFFNLPLREKILSLVLFLVYKWCQVIFLCGPVTIVEIDFLLLCCFSPWLCLFLFLCFTPPPPAISTLSSSIWILFNFLLRLKSPPFLHPLSSSPLVLPLSSQSSRSSCFSSSSFSPPFPHLNWMHDWKICFTTGAGKQAGHLSL